MIRKVPINKNTIRAYIRWMIRRDMPEVLDIENQCFSNPWTMDDLVRYLRLRNCIGMVSEYENKITGYMVYELEKTKIILDNFAVNPEFHGRGIGNSLIQKLVGKLSLQRRKAITLDIRESNLRAQLFFRNRGFRAVKILRNYYQETDEDAYRFAYRYRPNNIVMRHVDITCQGI